jgi:hypothetical protein
MKTKQLFLIVLLLVIISNVAKAQNGNLSNTILGGQAGDHSSGERNTFIGVNSGGVNYSGNDNVFIGNSSGYESEYGNNNTYLGSYSGAYATGSNNIFIGFYAGENENGNNKLYIENTNTSSPLIWGDFALNQLKFNGKVGIGNGFGNFPTIAGSVNVAAYNLFVKGGILTEEVRVNLQSAWADYVFEENYNLKSLEEVEAFISQNGHLPNMPSAKQVKEEGIELGEMVKMQQEKIEELTLYLLQLNKENRKEKEENKILLKKLSDLEEKVNLLLNK